MVSLRQLRYLESLSETRHFGHAAEACAVSQPALSMQIKELEDELQLSLVERRKSGIELTEQGEEIARRARTILASVGDLDLILVALPMEDPEVETLHLFDDRFVLATKATKGNQRLRRATADLLAH